MEYSFGSWVKRRRKSLDLTQQELANRVGCSVSAIFKIESDERRPSRQIVELLAAKLEIPADQRDLFTKVARQESAAGRMKSAVPPVSPRPADPPFSSNLPLPLNPLVGREHELHAIQQKIQDPICRLLTLTGPGGVGKTRLALEAAQRMRDHYTNDVHFISLVGTSAPEFIIPAIGDVLGFTFSGQSALKAQLLHFLKEKQLLLILDNLEHLLDGIGLLDELLEFAPEVKLLTTSREPLNLSAEWVFEVHGLPVPSDAHLKDLPSSSAAALFLQRAKQVNLNFMPTAEDLLAIARICQLVEGRPLGLELAASWVRVASMKEVALEIEQNMDFLTTTARDVPQRHRSMRAVFDHSWRLLSDDERQAMQRLSLFRGGFTREAAGQIAEAGLALLSGLVDKSFVRRSGAGRYELHELTRQYAAAHLENDPQQAAAAHTLHAEYYLTLLRESESDLRSVRQKDRFQLLKPEMDNIRAAWNFAVTGEAIDLLRRGAGGFYYFYELHQFFQEAEARYKHAAEMVQKRLTALGETPSAAEKTWLLGALVDMQGRQAFFLQRLGHNPEALALYRLNLKRLQSLDEPFLLPYNLIFYGIVTWAVGEYEEAARSFQQGIPLTHTMEHPWLQAIGLCFLGALKHDQGDLTGAYDHLDQAMGICRETGDPYVIMLIGALFSRTARARGQVAQAQDLLEKNLRIARETGNRWAIGLGLEQLAVIAHETGEDAMARQMLAESVDLHREVGDMWSLSRALHTLSRLEIAQHDLNAAQQSAIEGLRAAVQVQYFPNALDSLAALADVLAAQGQAGAALEMALLILNHPSSPQDARTCAERLRVQLEPGLTNEQIVHLQTSAQGKTIESYVQFVPDSRPIHS